jgi:ADP-ribose pyrophosphatase
MEGIPMTSRPPITLDTLLESPPGPLERIPIYDGRIVRLGLEGAVMPDGRIFPIEIVRHAGASAVVPVLEDLRVVLIRQFRYAANTHLLEIPAGRLEPDESPEACAHRELQEETGYTDEKIHLYLATGLTPGPTALETDEYIQREEMPLEKAIDLVRQGEIRDGKTIVGLMAAALRMGLLRWMGP